MKAPFIPPKNKLISNTEVKKMEKQELPVLDEIIRDQGNIKPYDPKRLKDKNWVIFYYFNPQDAEF